MLKNRFYHASCLSVLSLGLWLSPIASSPATESTTQPAVQASDSEALTSLPIISADLIELHGEMYGNPFWIRVFAADKRFGGNRIAQLVYTPRKPETVGSTVLVDHPYLLLNGQAQLIAWNERSEGLSGLEFRGNRKQPGYAINFERSVVLADGQLSPTEVRGSFNTAEPVWDAYLAPLFLALTYQSTEAQQPTAKLTSVDFFGGEDPLTATSLKISGSTITLPSGQTGTIATDAQGRLKSISDEDGKTIFKVDGWLSDQQQSSEKK